MFTYPVYPPKDYILKKVPKIQTDSAQFTPECEPRVTQTSLGIFCAPIEYPEGETPKVDDGQDVSSKLIISPYVLENWANNARAWWVDKPGKADYFLHNIYKKYNVKFDSYNPANRFMEKVFNRSYKYELVCLEENRLEKLRNKCENEQKEWDLKFKRNSKKEHEKRNPPMTVLECKLLPPFWWKDNNEKVRENIKKINDEENLQNLPWVKRWAEQPCLTAAVVDDPCKRKYDMNKVGQPFKNEACNFYYTNYPPPNIKFTPKRIN